MLDICLGSDTFQAGVSTGIVGRVAYIIEQNTSALIALPHISLVLQRAYFIVFGARPRFVANKDLLEKQSGFICPPTQRWAGSFALAMPLSRTITAGTPPLEWSLAGSNHPS